MKVTGSIEIDSPDGVYTVKGSELDIDTFTSGKEIELSHDTGEWSVKKIFGGKPGSGDGDWETENCTIIQEDIHIEYVH